MLGKPSRRRNKEAEYRAAEIWKRAERRAGELLIEEAKTGRRAKKGERKANIASDDISKPILSDRGITLDQSSQWQQLAKVPTEQFEELVKQPGIIQ